MSHIYESQVEGEAECDYYSLRIADKLDITKFAADIIQYILTRSWYNNKLVHNIIKADAISNFDFCSFLRGDYDEELIKYNIKIYPEEYIPDYRKILLELYDNNQLKININFFFIQKQLINKKLIII